MPGHTQYVKGYLRFFCSLPSVGEFIWRRTSAVCHPMPARAGYVGSGPIPRRTTGGGFSIGVLCVVCRRNIPAKQWFRGSTHTRRRILRFALIRKPRRGFKDPLHLSFRGSIRPRGLALGYSHHQMLISARPRRAKPPSLVFPDLWLRMSSPDVCVLRRFTPLTCFTGRPFGGATDVGLGCLIGFAVPTIPQWRYQRASGSAYCKGWDRGTEVPGSLSGALLPLVPTLGNRTRAS